MHAHMRIYMRVILMRTLVLVRPNASRESLTIGPPAGLRPVGGSMLRHRLESGRNPARKTDVRPGSTTA